MQSFSRAGSDFFSDVGCPGVSASHTGKRGKRRCIRRRQRTRPSLQQHSFREHPASAAAPHVPNFVAVVLSYNLTFALEIRVNRQTSSPFSNFRRANISFSASATACLFVSGGVAFSPTNYFCGSLFPIPGGLYGSVLLTQRNALRYADERKEFYTAEFNLAKIAEWFGGQLVRVKFAVIMGRHTQIYQEKYREDSDTTIIIDEYQSLSDVQNQILEFLPEAVYYDRNVYGPSGSRNRSGVSFRP